MNEINSSLSVLTVDDDPNALEILRVFLESQQHTVYSALNGHDALHILQDYDVDVVVSDVMMPQMNGFELCQIIKSNKDTALLPVILVTATEDKASRLKGIEVGCDDFFSKPFDRLELQARVRSLGDLKRSNEDLDRAEEVLKMLAYSVEARDGTTSGHCQRLVEMGVAFAKFLDLDRVTVDVFAKAGILHDIGKIYVPDYVLLKPGPLNGEEWEIMKKHTTEGELLLRPLRTVRNVLGVVRSHHECWDGSGYPDGLCGEEIPFAARAFQLLDIYDALTHPRPYKEGFSAEKSLDILRKETLDGKRDPHLTNLFIAFIVSQEGS